MKIYEVKKIGEITSRDGEVFTIFFGISEEHVDQLKKYSLDKSDIELQNNTGDLARFGTGSYEDWFAKNRTPFSLIHNKTRTLAAFAWLGPKSLGLKSIKFGRDEKLISDDNWHTLALRSYNPFRGKGVTKTFAHFIIEYYKKLLPDALLWSGMDDRNLAIVNLMNFLGFRKREDISDLNSHWLIMTKEL